MGRLINKLPIPSPSSESIEFALGCEAVLKEVYPPLLDKVQGMIDGWGGDSTGKVFKSYLYTRQGGRTGGCSNIAIMPESSVDGDLIVGCNYDWFYSALKWCELRSLFPKGLYSTMSYTHHWAGSQNALNSQGLFVAISAIPRKEAISPGLQWHLIIDVIMDKCKSLNEALDFITSVPHLGSYSYLLAHDSGEAAVVEARPGEVRVREPERGILVATNHLVGGRGQRDELPKGDSVTRVTSKTRYEKARRSLEEHKGSIDVAVLEEVLKDHSIGLCLGNHDVAGVADPDHELGTIWSLISRPERRELAIAPGHPCQNQYRKNKLQ